MTTISHKKIVPYTREQMYALVNAVDDYAKFLPWCSSSKIITQTAEGMTAEMTVKNTVTFTTQNTLTPYSKIELKLVSGPFKQLHGAWQFVEAAEGHCEIQVHLEFTFKNTLLKIALGSIFEEIGHKLITAFIARAKVVYGS
jgi:ribosome-associated toxin RatA of RatAB toxin-antitoxin module